MGYNAVLTYHGSHFWAVGRLQPNVFGSLTVVFLICTMGHMNYVAARAK